MDSMVNHYTSAKKPRSEDAYTPGGKRGKRPDRAVNVYCKCIRNIYRDIPIVIGGASAALLITIIGTTVFYLPFLYPQVRIC